MHIVIMAIMLLGSPAPMVLEQCYIGTHKDMVRQFVPQEQQGFVFDTEVQVRQRSFIKFVDAAQEQTMLFVFDSEGLCTCVSRMYNTWLYDDLLGELKRRYRYAGTDLWFDDALQLEIRLKRNDWFITVEMRRRQPAPV
ncbi:MAG: hypothetical protein IJU72_04295 [Bacteroidales bacterium]|nr:hypothetical protein [Bacteroidales bacterium]